MAGVDLSRRAFLSSALGCAGAVVLRGEAAWAQADARPWTIPALREWRPMSGSVRWCGTGRIVVHDGGALDPTASKLAADLKALTGVAPTVVHGGAAQAGDVVLDLRADDPVLGSEGYRMVIDHAIVISANAPAGVFYGTRTLLQVLAQDAVMPAGVARDWPRYPERGLLVDIGRQHFSFEWLADHIEILGWLKLNQLHLHFTENLGWRIASDGHPEVVSEEHLTKHQVRQLLDMAAANHVTLVPEVDIPGHMGAALRNHPELQLRDALGRPNPNSLDFTLPEGRQFAYELIDEYLDLFPGPNWHTGADEFLVTVPPFATPADYALYPRLEAYARQEHGPDANAKDGILGFLNMIHQRVQAKGKTLRVWNDGLAGGNVVALHPDVTVEWWTDLDGKHPAELLAAGHRISNMSWFPTYYINGVPGGFVPGWPNEVPFPNEPRDQDVYDGWETHRFHGPMVHNGITFTPAHEVDPDEPANLGSKIAIWNDDPTVATEQETAAGVAPRLRSMAQKTWGSPLLAADYTAFRSVIDRVGGPMSQTITPATTCAPGSSAADTDATVRVPPPAAEGRTAPGSLPATGGSPPLWAPALLLGGAIALRARTETQRP